MANGVQTTGTRADLNNANSGSQSLSVTAGDTIFVSASIQNASGAPASGDVTDNAGNSYTLDVSLANTGIYAAIWRATAGSTATITITLNPTGANAYAAFNAVSVRGLSGGPDQIKSNNGTSTSPATGSTSTLAQASEFVIACFGLADTTTNNVTVPASSGYTNYWQQNSATASSGGAGDYKDVAATTAVSASWTFTNSKAWAAVLATYKYQTNTTVTPGAASLTLTRSTPVLSTKATPSAASLAVSGSAAVVGGGVRPSAASLNLTMSTPLLISGTITPGSASLALTGSVPVLSSTLTPGALALLLAGSAAVVGGGVVPGAGALVITGSTPGIVAGTVVSPGAASLALSGAVPVLAFVIVGVPRALTLSGSTPRIGLTVNPTPAALVIGLSVAGSIVRVYKRGVSADIYDVDGVTKLGAGPLVTISQVKYGQHLDQIGQATVLLSSSDPQKSLLTARRQLWIYVGGEGLVFRGKILPRQATPYGPMQIQLQSLEQDLVDAKSGMARILTALSPSGLLSAILPAGWSAGTVDSVGPTYTRRVDAKSDWEVIADGTKTYGNHVRADVITLSGGAPVKKIDMPFASVDSGLIFMTVSEISPELAENTTVFPLQAIEEFGDGSQIVNHLVVLGPGDGYPMMTLQAASKGANLCANPSFESNTTGWSGFWTGSGSIGQNGAVATSGSFSLLVTNTSGVSYWTQYSATISGATAGRIYTASLWFYGSGPTIGKTAFLQVNEIGGASLQTGTAVSFTVIAGWQYVSFSRTLTANDRTSVQLQVGFSGSATGGDVFWIDQVSLWESTNAAFCVQSETGLGGVTEYFIEDGDSVETYGRLVAYPAVKDAQPTVATKAAYIAAIDGMYDIGTQILYKRRTEPLWYTAKPLGLKHVDAGVQRIKPGYQVRLLANAPVIDLGETDPRAAFNVDTYGTVMGFERTISADGTDDWVVELSTAQGGLARMYDDERLAALWSDFSSGQNDLKTSNYTMEA